MKKLIIIYFIFPLITNCFSQESEYVTNDTVNLEEIKVTSIIPLADDDIVSYYKSSNFSTIDNVMERIGGVSLIRRGSYAQEPQMHGFSAGQINVTIDGMRIFGACTDKMDPVTSYVEPDNLKSLKVAHGTNGGKTGNAVGGSLDMVLQEPEFNLSKTVNAVVGAGYSTITDGKNFNAGLDISKRKWALKASSVYRKNNNYKGGDGKTVYFSQFEKVNMHTSVKFLLSENQILKADFLLDNAYNVGYPALPMDVGLAEAKIYSLEYQVPKISNKLINFKSKVYLNTIYHLMDDSQRDSLYFIDDMDVGVNDSVYMRMDMPGWSNTFGFFAQTDFLISENNKLFVKLDHYYNQSRAEMTMFMNNLKYPGEPPMYAETWPDIRRNVSGIYIENTTDFTESLNLKINGRLDYSMSEMKSEYGKQQFSVFGLSIDNNYIRLIKSFNLIGNYTVFKPFSVTIGLGYAERLPTVTEQFGFYLYNALDGYDYIGAPDIKKEKSQQINIDLNYSGDKLNISMKSYFSYLSDFIIGEIDPDIPKMNMYASGTKVYINIPNAKLLAYDILMLWKPLNKLSIISSIKYTYAETNAGIPLPQIPPLKSLVSVKYKKKKWIILAESEFAAAQKRINPNFGESVTPAYQIFNLRGAYKFKFSKNAIELASGIENIFNEIYSEHLDWGNFLRPGRNFYFNLKFTF